MSPNDHFLSHYILDPKGRRILVGLSFEETAEFEQLDARLPYDGKPVCLQDGLYLKLAELSRLGLIRFGHTTGLETIRWSHPRSGEVALARIRADLSLPPTGYLEVEIEGVVQRIEMVARMRHFGGHQWYFRCPHTGLLTSVLWKPAGAKRFSSRQTWSDQVAYLHFKIGMLLSR